MIRKLYLLSGLLLVACSTPEAEVAPSYFDLAGWLDAGRAQLSAGSAVSKTVILNGHEEVLDKDGYTWEAELESLQQWDINRAAWRGAYKVDSVFREGALVLCRYEALEDDLPVRRMDVHFLSGVADSLEVHTRVKNPLHTTKAQYHYRRGRTYHLIQENHRRFGKDQTLEVHTTIR